MGHENHRRSPRMTPGLWRRLVLPERDLARRAASGRFFISGMARSGGGGGSAAP